MRKLAQVTTAMVLATLVLSGCGADAGDGDETDGDPTATPSAPLAATDWGRPATGPVITGTGYTYRVPKTWGDVTARAKKVQASSDSAASEKAATDGFADNISVGYQSTDATLAELEAVLPAKLRSLVKKLDTLPHVTIDGVEALHHRGLAQSAGTTYFLEQFAVLRDGRVAIINFSLGQSLPVAEREAMVASVMASWTWSD
jgi:hypothetical protein